MRVISWAVFLMVGAALAAARMRAHAHHRDATAAGLFDRVMADRRVRLAVLVIWWWLGWHFLAGQTL